MRNYAKRLVSMLLAVALVFALGTTAFAAEDESIFSLKSTEGAIKGDLVGVSVDVAQAGVVADGVLTFTYDSAKLSFHSVAAGAAWTAENDLSLQANGETLGQVAVAFAGVEPAEAGTLFVLNFVALGEGQSTVTLEQEDSYISDSQAALTAEATVDVVCHAASFTDVNLGEFYHEGIDFVVSRGLMIGIGDDLFAPKNGADRAMLVTILYRMSGAPEVEGTMPFADVAEGSYYYDAVLWAYEEGIAKGMGDNLFAPALKVTREQMVTFFGRYAEMNGISVETEADLKDFTDAASVSEYAQAYMAWAVEQGIIKGMGDNTLEPKGNSTRGQLATVIMRYVLIVTE